MNERVDNFCYLALIYFDINCKELIPVYFFITNDHVLNSFLFEKLQMITFNLRSYLNLISIQLFKFFSLHYCSDRRFSCIFFYQTVSRFDLLELFACMNPPTSNPPSTASCASLLCCFTYSASTHLIYFLFYTLFYTLFN